MSRGVRFALLRKGAALTAAFSTGCDQKADGGLKFLRKFLWVNFRCPWQQKTVRMARMQQSFRKSFNQSLKTHYFKKRNGDIPRRNELFGK
jgi:hypothetical protein